MSDSEFGRGYATCLRQFTFHQARLAEMLDMYAGLRTEHPDLFDERDAVALWANGASDHLYELERPPRMQTTEWRQAQTLQSRALDIGHGFGPSSPSDKAEARDLLARAEALLLALERRGHAVETLDDCINTDERLGLHPEQGAWSCMADIRHAVEAAR